MSHFNEHTLEMAIMELFKQQGYSHVNGETIHKEWIESDRIVEENTFVLENCGFYANFANRML